MSETARGAIKIVVVSLWVTAILVIVLSAIFPTRYVPVEAGKWYSIPDNPNGDQCWMYQVALVEGSKETSSGVWCEPSFVE